jgi:uncharacterized phage protein (TIGR01671 family)
MREILFRAKAKEDGKWIEGFPVRIYDYGGFVWDMHPFNTNFETTRSIDPKTIGQFTGLTDKNGKKIFEGDVLDCKSGLYERCKVIFNEFCSAFQLECADGFSDFFLCSINHKEMEIIGNIHDNPELLEVTDNA